MTHSEYRNTTLEGSRDMDVAGLTIWVIAIGIVAVIALTVGRKTKTTDPDRADDED